MDDVTKQSDPAASPAAVAVAEPSPQEVLDNLTPDERAKWRETGELPEVKGDTVKVAPPKQEEKETPEAKGSENKPASEADKGSEPAPARSNAETRKEELGRDIQELLQRRSQLERETRELEARRREPAAARETAKEEEKPPKLEDFKGEDAYDKYLEAKIDYETKKRTREVLAEERQGREKAEREAREQAMEAEAKGKWAKAIEAAEKLHPDFRQVALDKKIIERVPEGSVLDLYVAQSEHGREVLYHLAKNPAKLDAILGHQAPLDAARAIFEVEREVLAQQATNKVTKAPEPPASAGGPASKSTDPIAEAVGSGDFATYQREMNAKELAQKK